MLFFLKDKKTPKQSLEVLFILKFFNTDCIRQVTNWHIDPKTLNLRNLEVPKVSNISWNILRRPSTNANWNKIKVWYSREIVSSLLTERGETSSVCVCVCACRVEDTRNSPS